jgi:Chemotaxis phosphatase CheX
MGHPVTTEVWMDRILEAVDEVAGTTFDSVANDVERSNRLPVNREGSLLPVQKGSESLHLGVLSDKQGCIALTRGLLQMDADEEIGDEDIADAVGEIVNIVAGVMQRALDGDGEGVTLGYPVYVRGEIIAPHKSETLCATLNFGPARADIIIVRGDPPQSKQSHA